jgi:uncharacterized protein YlxW (UPF0749 family)
MNSNYDFNGVKAPAGNAKLYSLQYASFVVTLVKAVQELSEENQHLKAEISDIKNVISSMMTEMEAMKTVSQESSVVRSK